MCSPVVEKSSPSLKIPTSIPVDRVKSGNRSSRDFVGKYDRMAFGIPKLAIGIADHTCSEAVIVPRCWWGGMKLSMDAARTSLSSILTAAASICFQVVLFSFDHHPFS